MTTQRMMREASIPRLLLQMSLPVILVMLVNVIYNMADVFFMGRTGETMAVAAIALCGPVFSVFSAFLKSKLGSTAAANVGCEAVLCFRLIIKKQHRHKQRGIIIAASQGAGSVNCRGIRQTRKST